MRNIPRQKITKSQRKIAREEERNKRTTKYSENNEQNSNSKSLPTINCFKGIWIKFSNQKMTEWGKKKKQIQLYAAYRRLNCLKEICHYSLYLFLESKRMEKDILGKC